MAQWVESTETGGDRSINSLCSRQLLTSSSLLKNEKKKKKRNPEVIYGEGDENDEEKTNEKWLWFGKTKQENENEAKSEVM